jgi:isocitrate dehydrogenase
MNEKTPITIAKGDGIGPEIMDATLQILEAAGAQLELEEIQVGFEVYQEGFSAGIKPDAWDSLRRTKVFLKSPITTPSGSGFKSLNVTIRKSLGLYANVRPTVAYHPYVRTKHPGMDVVIVRENEEDLYAGIEHRQTQEVTQCLKLITQPGSEKIARYAFEYARANNRKRVTCMIKDNIMKITDGLFYETFKQVAEEYPDIQSDRMIIDIGTARLADTPEDYDVVVMPNLYGDIASDVVTQLSGSVGLGGSANIGEHVAMFEAIHGSAPDIAGKGIANPSGLLLGAVMMLVHIGQAEVAERVHNAWLKTIEDGVHTGDIYKDDISSERVNTQGFTQAVIDRLGQTPTELPAVSYADAPTMTVPSARGVPAQDKALIGVDVFLDWTASGRNPDVIGGILRELEGDLHLQMITNRGVKVFPDGLEETFWTDHWRCRFITRDGEPINHQHVIDLLGRIHAAGLDFIKTEHLYTFDGEPGFSLGQGQ